MKRKDERPWRRVVSTKFGVDTLECGHTWDNLLMSPNSPKPAKKRKCQRCEIEVQNSST